MIFLSLYDTNLSTFTNIFYKLCQMNITCRLDYFLWTSMQTMYVNVDRTSNRTQLICSTDPKYVWLRQQFSNVLFAKLGMKMMIFEPEIIKMHCFPLKNSVFDGQREFIHKLWQGTNTTNTWSLRLQNRWLVSSSSSLSLPVLPCSGRGGRRSTFALGAGVAGESW